MKEELINILCAVLGLAFVTFTRMQSLKTDFEKANQEFVYRKYFQKEMLGITCSFLAIAIWYLIFGEVTQKYPAILGFIRCAYVAIGAMGTWALQRGLGKTKAFIRNVVDVKTDIADQKQ